MTNYYIRNLVPLVLVAAVANWNSQVHGFTPAFGGPSFLSSTRTSTRTRVVTSPTVHHMAGFGGASSSSNSNKETKLKPKAQWDRYADLKQETMIRVAVRAIGGEDPKGEEWLEVGRVRSKENAFTEVAVARQRALIADHGRRLFPLQVSPKDKLEWAYWKQSDNDTEQDNGEWVVVDKSVVEGAPAGIEKQIGFEGRPDPATGFYCHYNAGRLIDAADSKPVLGGGTAESKVVKTQKGRDSRVP